MSKKVKKKAAPKYPKHPVFWRVYDAKRDPPLIGEYRHEVDARRQHNVHSGSILVHPKASVDARNAKKGG